MPKKNQSVICKPTPPGTPKRSIELDFGELSCIVGSIEFLYTSTHKDKYSVTFKGGTSEEVVVEGMLPDLYKKLRAVVDSMETELFPPPKGGLC
jgi:hypothetical protein